MRDWRDARRGYVREIRFAPVEYSGKLRGYWLVDYLCAMPGSAENKRSTSDVGGRLREVFGTAEVSPVVVVCAEGANLFASPCKTQINVDDREHAFLVH